jgi:hypothetical protein
MYLLVISAFRQVLKVSLVAGLLLTTTVAQALTIDFEGIGVIAGPPFDVSSQGFTVQDLVTPGTPEPIIRPAALSPNGTDLYAFCGFCAGSSGFNLFANNGAPFALESIDLGGFGNAADEFDFTVTGFRVDGTTRVKTLNVTVPEGVQTLSFGSAWENLISVEVIVNNQGNVGFSGSAYDNIVITPGELMVEIDVIPTSTANMISPEADGPIAVAILSTNLIDGDSLDFDATQVDPATLAFGPGSAPVNSFGAVTVDADGDGDLDFGARFETADAAIACADMSVSIAGETFSGTPFMGMGSITTDCDGGCHSSP